MFKNYDYRLVHSYRSYTIKEIVRLFKAQELHDKTVRGWIGKGGLEVIVDGNRLLIYGGILKQFLRDRSKNRRRKLHINEFFCFKCKHINSPLENTIIDVNVRSNGTINACAICPNCVFEMNRLYKQSEIQQIVNLFKLEQKALIVLSDSSSSACNAHHKTDQKSSDLEPQANCSSYVTQGLETAKDFIQPETEKNDAQN